MDAILILVGALGYFIYLIKQDDVKTSVTASQPAELMEDTPRTAKLNEAFYEDPNAFTEISSVLGFPVR